MFEKTDLENTRVAVEKKYFVAGFTIFFYYTNYSYLKQIATFM